MSYSSLRRHTERPTMQRRHFEIVANAIASARLSPAERSKLAVAVANEFAKTNQKFNRVRFLKHIEAREIAA